MPDKLPYIALYVGDWRKDPAVQCLDYYERGVWMELLFFMHESPERGYLRMNGEPISDDEIAVLLGIPKARTKQILSKLVTRGVASRQDDGTLYNRRMARATDLSAVRSEAGSKGGRPGKQTESKTVSKPVSLSKQNADNDTDNDSVQGKGGEYPEDFELFWGCYPDRHGGNPKKSAYKTWRARRKEGVKIVDLMKAVKSYAREMNEAGKVGTEFVMQAQTFLGPNERWREYVEKEKKEQDRIKKVYKDAEPLPDISDEDRAESLEAIKEIKGKLGKTKGAEDDPSTD